MFDRTDSIESFDNMKRNSYESLEDNELGMYYVERPKYSENLLQYIQNGPVIVTGKEGTGKTELVKRLIHSNKYNNNNVIWINADSKYSTYDFFERFAITIFGEEGISKYAYKINKKNAVRHIYKHFRHEKVIFVFDNVSNNKYIEEFLPINFDLYDISNNLIITTPKDCEYKLDNVNGNNKMVEVDNFTDEEVIKFVTLLYEHSGEVIDKEDILYLARYLNNFPLALQLAGRILITQKMTINELIDELDNMIPIFTDDTNARELSRCIHLIAMILKEEEYGQEALKVLQTIAYLAPNHISLDLFLKSLAEDDIDKIKQIVYLLEKYNLVSNHNGMISVHSMIQSIWRQTLEGDEEHIDVLLDVLTQMHIYFIDTKNINGYLPHIYQMWDHALSYELVSAIFVRDVCDHMKFKEYFKFLFECMRPEILQKLFAKLAETHCQQMVDIQLLIHEFTVNLLGMYKNDKQGESNFSELHKACRSGNLRQVKDLLENDFDVNIKTERMYTPLHISARYGFYDVTKTLLDYNSAINARTYDNHTPLHFAAKYNNCEIIKLLLKQDGIHINSRTKQQMTPLHYACVNNNCDIVELLLNNGAMCDPKNLENATPLYLASQKNLVNIAKVLLKYHANVNSQTIKGNTPLHTAVKRGNIDVVQLLIANGADSEIKNFNDMKPVDVLPPGEEFSELFNILTRKTP